MNRSANILLCCVITLAALGTVMVFSAISARATSLGVGLGYLVKHVIWIGIGLAGMLVMWRVDFRMLERRWLLVAVVGFVLLAAVLIPGIGACRHGARRWIRFGPMGIQPSECVKLTMLVAVCHLVARSGEGIRNLRKGVLPPLAIAGAAALLIVVEPDFGTAALVGALGVLVVLAAGAPVTPIAAVGAAGASGLAFLIWRSPAKLARVFAFLDPWKHKDAAGYQVVHSLISLGSGGLFGRGLGAGRQKLFYLPEADTDFIFSIVGEELGLIGTLVVVVLFVVLIRQGMLISERAPNAFGSLLAFGITMMIALQAIMHMAVVSASMPTKGIGLPFVSSGGSSLLVCMTGVGILMNIASQSRAEPVCAAGMRSPVRAAG